jgi:hypothetical protein
MKWVMLAVVMAGAIGAAPTTRPTTKPTRPIDFVDLAMKVPWDLFADDDRETAIQKEDRREARRMWEEANVDGRLVRLEGIVREVSRDGDGILIEFGGRRFLENCIYEIHIRATASQSAVTQAKALSKGDRVLIEGIANLYFSSYPEPSPKQPSERHIGGRILDANIIRAESMKR